MIAVDLPETAIPVTPENIAQVSQEITRNQTKLDFHAGRLQAPPGRSRWHSCPCLAIQYR
jgi:hypothetical protein